MYIVFQLLGDFYFDLYNRYCQYQRSDSKTGNHWSVRRQTNYDVTDGNNNMSFEGLDIRYH